MRIEDIKDPSFLVTLSSAERESLATDIRAFILKEVAEKGGHLSANLGVVELTIALETVFNSPKDRIIWDVGHQTYTHKILTGRARDFSTLGDDKGLSRFPSYRESPRDAFETGHSSTSIAALAGFLLAREAGKEIGEVVAVIGDSAFQNGLALSAFNYLGSRRDLKGIIVLNDNSMAISENFRALAPIANDAGAESITKFLSALGFDFIDCPDGHDMNALITSFKRARASSRSVLVHVVTKKGKGYAPSEADKLGRYHGTGPFNLATGVMREHDATWGEEIASILSRRFARDDNLYLLSPAMIYNSGLEELARAFPRRVIDCGITEEMAVVMAAAMAHCGVKVIVAIYATFLQRAYDALAHDIARPLEHVIFLIDHAGLVEHDGSTHQGILDMPFLLSLPTSTVVSPSSIESLTSYLDMALASSGPWFIRYPQGPAIHDKKSSQEKIRIRRTLSKTNVLTYGRLAALYDEALPEGIGLIEVPCQKPFTVSSLPDLTGKTLIIAEECVGEGGFASEVCRQLVEKGLKVHVVVASLPKGMDYAGDLKALLRKSGLLPEQIASRGAS